MFISQELFYWQWRGLPDVSDHAVASSKVGEDSISRACKRPKPVRINAIDTYCSSSFRVLNNERARAQVSCVRQLKHPLPTNICVVYFKPTSYTEAGTECLLRIVRYRFESVSCADIFQPRLQAKAHIVNLDSIGCRLLHCTAFVLTHCVDAEVAGQRL